MKIARIVAVGSLGVVVASLFACNDSGVIGAAAATPTPTATATAPTPTPTAPTPTPIATDTATPTPSPTATPVACEFYGIDSSSKLWILDPINVTATQVGATGQSSLTDIAITPDNRIIAIKSSSAWELDPMTGHATQIAATAWLAKQDALDALPDGRILVGGSANLIAIDTGTGMQTSLGAIPPGRVFSGDIAASGSNGAFATAKVTSGTANDHLIAFDFVNGTVTDVGDLGYPKVFGLDFGCDGLLYGMTASTPPKLLRVDPLTAQTTNLGTMTGGPSTLWGAAGPAH